MKPKVWHFCCLIKSMTALCMMISATTHSLWSEQKNAGEPFSKGFIVQKENNILQIARYITKSAMQPTERARAH